MRASGFATSYMVSSWLPSGRVATVMLPAASNWSCQTTTRNDPSLFSRYRRSSRSPR